MHPRRETHTRHHEVWALEHLVAAHEDVEVEVGLREHGHV